MDKSFYNIFKTFFKVGTMLLGGGYVILPLLESELVDKKEWLKLNELYEYFALSQSLPGIIAANVSVFTGYKIKGQIGAFAAITGVIMPAFIAIILIASVFEQVAHYGIVQDIFNGIAIGVIVLLFMSVKEMWKKCVVDQFSGIIFLTAFILSAGFKLSPAIIIISAIIIGALFARKHRLKMLAENLSDEVII